jgi:hypothetical protein
MNELAEFPDDLDAPAVRGYSPIQVLAHETAHRWLAYPLFRSGAANSSALLGYQQAHWSFFFSRCLFDGRPPYSGQWQRHVYDFGR